MSRKFALTGSLGVMLLMGLCAVAFFLFRSWACGVDVVDRLALPDSTWEIRAEVSGCSAVDGNLIIVAEHASLPFLRRELVRYGDVPDIRLMLDGKNIVVAGERAAQAVILVDRFNGFGMQLRVTNGRVEGN